MREGDHWSKRMCESFVRGRRYFLSPSLLRKPLEKVCQDQQALGPLLRQYQQVTKKVSIHR